MKIIKRLILINIIFSSFTFADAINQELIFGDSYTGYFRVSANTQEVYFATIGYTQPNLSTTITEPILLPVGCMEGGGGDCTGGTPYISEKTDSAGNIFYLINTQNKSRAWISQPEGSEKLPLDIYVGSGSSFLLQPDDAAATDTSKLDGIPSADAQRLSAIMAMNAKVSPELGQLDISLENNNADAKIVVWPSNQKPETKTGKVLSLHSLNPQGSSIQLNVLRREGKYILVVASSIVDAVQTNRHGAADDLSFFWIDPSNINFHYTPISISAMNPAPIGYENPLMITSNESVVKVKKFNGKAYAFIETSVYLFDPNNFNAETKEFSTIEFKFPLGWKKIRDNRGRLRIWFQQDSGC